jgi:DNA-binding transcriptional MerR regulator
MPKRSNPSDSIFNLLAIEAPRFGSGEVARILGVELWQLNRFLSRYELKSSGRLGEGRGSRRVYNQEDIYRIATAMSLIRDGFALKLVAQIIATLEDEDFHGGHNERYEFSEFGISLQRGDAGPMVRIFRSDKFPLINAESKTYYAMNLSKITHDVDRRIASLEK